MADDDVQVPRSDDPRREFSEIIGVTAGYVSLCWEPRPEGEFDSALAAAEVEKAVDQAMDVLAGDLTVAFTIIANAHGGDWSLADPEWRAAAERFRDRFHSVLDARKEGTDG